METRPKRIVVVAWSSRMDAHSIASFNYQVKGEKKGLLKAHGIPWISTAAMPVHNVALPTKSDVVFQCGVLPGYMRLRTIGLGSTAGWAWCDPGEYHSSALNKFVRAGSLSR